MAKELQRDQGPEAPCPVHPPVERPDDFSVAGTPRYTYLIFTCYTCKDIKIVDVENKKTYIAHSGGHKYHRVCAAEDAVFVYNFEDPFQVRSESLSIFMGVPAGQQAMQFVISSH